MIKKSFTIAIVAVLALAFLSSCSGQPGTTNKVTERTGAITLLGKPLTLLGPEIKVGQKAPDFSLVPPYDRIEVSSNITNVSLAQSQGKIRLISVVPSLDTPVCDLQTQRFEVEANKFETVVYYTVSVDLPFAQSRYCGTKSVTRMEVLSDYYDGSFGIAYGVFIKELHVLSRSIFIIDQNNVVRYVQYVQEISQPVDFDAALAALRALGAPETPPNPAAPAVVIPPATGSTLPPPPSAPPTTQGLQVGNMAPDFQLLDTTGKSVSLSSLRGKAVMLDFWATWCPFCRAERPLIQQTYDAWQNKGLVLLTVDIIGSRPEETQANLADFMKTNNYSFPVLLDVNQQVTKLYNIKFTPTNFLIDKNGIIQKITVGPFAGKTGMDDAIKLVIP